MNAYVIWFVLVSGCRWEDVPQEMGCSGRTAHRRLRLWEELGVWDRLHADLLRLLRQNEQLDLDLVIVDGVIVRAFGGGDRTGPSPVDRRKKGSKHTLLVDRQGVPLARKLLVRCWAMLRDKTPWRGSTAAAAAPA